MFTSIIGALGNPEGKEKGKLFVEKNSSKIKTSSCSTNKA
jgi:hypothetical protein